MKAEHRARPIILCVDDGETQTEFEVRKRLLEACGYRVLLARNARHAIEIFQLEGIDLVLTEQDLFTVPSGSRLTAAMKGLKPDVPVAVYSADWEISAEDMRHADLFITKLVLPEELLHTIERLLSRRVAQAA